MSARIAPKVATSATETPRLAGAPSRSGRGGRTRGRGRLHRNRPAASARLRSCPPRSRSRRRPTPAHPRRRRGARPVRRGRRAVRQPRGEAPGRSTGPARLTPARTARGRHRHHPDRAWRGQDHHGGGPHRRPAQARPAGRAHGAPAVPRPGVRHQGRRERRRASPGRSHGGVQPPPHRRLPRRRGGPQPRRGHGGQPPQPRQRARARARLHHLAADRGRERPRSTGRRGGARGGVPTVRCGRPGGSSPPPPR
jgi:hypothetical protein